MVPSGFKKVNVVWVLLNTAATIKFISAVEVVILVLPLIFIICQPLRIPAFPAADSLSTDFTLRSVDDKKNIPNPKSSELPLLRLFQSTCLIAKLKRSTGAVNPGSVLYGRIACIILSGSA